MALELKTSKREVTVAATQFSCTWDISSNVNKAEHVVREAAAKGAQIILLQELFETPYFCQDQKMEFFKLARPVEGHPTLKRMSALAAELQVVLPVSFFERHNNAYYNSLVVYDADGSELGRYRKSHIPDGTGYQEKFYFSPGDTGFKVFDTRYGRIGCLICWDQWFPEGARAVALQGAELIFYPSAIGSEPQDPALNSYPHWARTMQGHAAANVTPVIACNRVGKESGDNTEITFFGGSFITGPTGEIVAQVGKRTEGEHIDPKPAKEEGFVTATFDLEQLQQKRSAWGLFRDRRPDLYMPLLTLDGSNVRVRRTTEF